MYINQQEATREPKPKHCRRSGPLKPITAIPTLHERQAKILAEVLKTFEMYGLAPIMCGFIVAIIVYELLECVQSVIPSVSREFPCRDPLYVSLAGVLVIFWF